MRPDIDLRSSLDTRGAALLLTLSLLALAGFAALGGLLQPAVMETRTSDVSFTFIVMGLPLSIILPVLAVMITAGEWSDRSIQNTFLLRPGRLGVLGSKVIAVIVICAVLVALAVGFAAAATWIGGELIGEGADFSTFSDILTDQLIVHAAALAFGIATGVLLQSTVIALVAAIGVPFLVSTASMLAAAFGSQTLSDVIRAVDLGAAAAAVPAGTATAFELLPVLLLVALPVVLGARRWAVREVG